jgi:[NiFe] hydrogenase diaphorase moiety large subunit
MGTGTMNVEAIRNILLKHEANPTRLLQILRDVQDEFRHIPPAAQSLIARETGLPIAQVQGVTEFYSFLSTEKQGKFHLLVSDSISDHLLGSRDIAANLGQKLGVGIGQTRADERVSLDYTSCTGLCDQGPAGLVNGHWVPCLTPARIDLLADLIERDVALSDWPEELFLTDDNIQKSGLLLSAELPLGAALNKALQQGPNATLSEIERSGLRGRGGAGFQTAGKWHFCYQEPGEPLVCHQEPGERVVVCNADEGEPGTFKDRVLLNQYAHGVFEGMTICAATIRAKTGFLYLRGEYRHLRPRLEAILNTRRELGLLGKDIAGHTGFDFDIEIHLGAGAYICGEESALIESLEGKRGVPRNRPPYPVTHGYLGRPTVVNNVETFLAAAQIILHGAEWFAAHGTGKSRGTKILSICGDCAKPGIYEYAFGVTIREILQDCGAEDTQGIQVGGPSGTFIGANEFGRTLAFEDLATGGSFIIFNHSRNVLEIARNFTHFFAHESCGFCTPCRVGTSLLRNLLDKICDGHGTAGDMVELSRLATQIKHASHCGLGQTASNPILSTLERFPEIYQAHLKATTFEPGFDLDKALETSRRLTGRDDAQAHLETEGM